MSAAPLNVLMTRAGKLQPVCEFCGKVGRAITPDERGRISMWDLGLGWAVAPYPADFQHHDGSTGDLFECPACRKRLERGESLRARAYLEPAEPVVDPSDVEHVEQSAARAKASFRADVETREGAQRYVSEVLGEFAPEHDVPAIVEQLHEHAGRSWDMRRVPSEDFWRVVRAHGLPVPSPESHCADWPLCGHEDGCPQA